MRVPAVCAFPKKLEVIAAANRGPNPPPYWAHRSKRHLVRIVPPVPGLWKCFTHSNCVCNDVVSATNRVCGVVPQATDAGIAALRRVRKSFVTRMRKVGPLSEEETLDSFHGKKRARYAAALESLKIEPLSRRDARISSFVKSEKFNPKDKKNPDPRMIQARQPRYNIRLAQYMRPLEHLIYRMKGPMGDRCVVKGLNQQQRAELLQAKMARFDSPCVLSMDCSRFDKHVGRRVLEVEHEFYMGLCNDPQLEILLRWQRDNFCSTSNGVKYAVNGGRMSGDMNTACGNCVLMTMMVFAAMRGYRKWDLMGDGDDCLVIIEESDLSTATADLQREFLSFGQELKVEAAAREIHEVDFCQGRVVAVGDGEDRRLMFTRNWRKVLSQSACGVKHWGDPKMVRPMLSTVGMCEMALGAGVPVLQAFARALIRNGKGQLPKSLDVDEGLALRVKYECKADGLDQLKSVAVERPISMETRESFALAWGLSVGEQLHVEAILDAWTITTVVARDFPLEMDSTWEDMSSLETDLPAM